MTNSPAPFEGPRDVTTGGDRRLEWTYRDEDHRRFTLRSGYWGIVLRDEDADTGIELDEADLGPLAAMLADAQQHLTGGQR